MPLYSIDCYNLHANCNNKYRAGGVAVFVRNYLNAVINTDYSLNSADILSVDCNIGGLKLSILCVYRLHSVNISEFVVEFNSILSAVKSKNVLVLGDINIDILSNSRLIDEYKLMMGKSWPKIFD